MLEYYIIKYGLRPGRFRKGARLLCSLSAPLSVEANRAYLELVVLPKALYLPGYWPQEPAVSLLLEGAGLLLFSGSFLLLEPVTAARSLLSTIACRQRHIDVVILLGRAVCGAQRGALFPRALPEEAGPIQHS